MQQDGTKSFTARTPLHRRFSHVPANSSLIAAVGGEALQGSGFEEEQPETGFDESRHREGTETLQDGADPV